MPITDEDAALQAIAALECLSEEQKSALDSINSMLNNDEPFVDIHELFRLYNTLYFRDLLVPRVEVTWSPRLTLCAGICELSKDPSTGKFTRIRLKMSTPLLQYRPRSDTINTLLHEAIHAYFFVITSWRHFRGDDGTGHGVGFQLLADAINNHGNYEITIYHTFHDEVDSYRTHVWQCDGHCRNQPPYFGLVKRSMNRPPGKADSWWSRHQAECGGVYTKIQEPEPTRKQKEALSRKERAGRQKNKIDGWVRVEAAGKPGAEGKTSASPVERNGEGKTSARIFNGKRKTEIISSSGKSSTAGQKRLRADDDDDDDGEVLIVEKRVLVECPIRSVQVVEPEINEHLDVVHPV
ncbi:uncharacterized protein BDR25DRAFT_221571 [Lindgomyces ingoldianus]|uniref:Uncharacterized protein n=1 Tax=Lindgomyces ingoldianus TaxID=673940 RepID=A0ACB6QYN7_9PLEO|nr:uncharacterized protein BDR25DRAFT_221571 [Lindgomyces ingoldianus]KAF2472164.1 hypothetical protein BDR25DRAFT_221571 [Lindgomyces ingoldianus]